MRNIFLILFLSTSSITIAQQKQPDNTWMTDQYKQLIIEAENLYSNKKYLASAQAYSKAFIAFGNKGTLDDRYNAACSWSLAGNKDSTYYNLFKVAKSGHYTNLHHITNDPDLNFVRNDSRWNEVTALIKTAKEKKEKNYDKALVPKLDRIFEEDQKYRMQLDSIQKKFGFNSDEVKKHWQLISYKDSLNLIEIKAILDNRGWLGANIIGDQGNQTLFLVIQHADKLTRQKYLPMIREAVKVGKANPADLALMEDRAAMENGKKQIYGSQLMSDTNGKLFVIPVEDPDNLDKRRKEVGLPPMQEYLNYWSLKWDVEEYKKQLPQIEAYLKNVSFN